MKRLIGVGLIAFVLGAAADRWVVHNLKPLFPPAKAASTRVERAIGHFALSRIAPKVVILGDSIMAEGNWAELTGCPWVLNRAISGSTTADVLSRLDAVLAMKPALALVMAGTVDAALKIAPEVSARNMAAILSGLSGAGIEAVLVYPLPARSTAQDGAVNAHISALVSLYEKTAPEAADRQINARAGFLDGRGFLRADLSYDNLHLTPAGYAVLRDYLEPEITAKCRF